ncbi:MAG: hypothetical protein ACK2T7_02925 [Anaerolineales bacterium]
MSNQQDDRASVRCHSGYDYAQRPINFTHKGKEHQVARLVQEIRTPDGKQFLVETGSGQVFELIYAESTGEWQIRQM